jgi:hypothetical protein
LSARRCQAGRGAHPTFGVCVCVCVCGPAKLFLLDAPRPQQVADALSQRTCCCGGWFLALGDTHACLLCSASHAGLPIRGHFDCGLDPGGQKKEPERLRSPAHRRTGIP